MIDQEKPSPEAEAQHVCHTMEECKQMYAELTSEVKTPALKMLAEELASAKDEIKKAFDADPENWVAPYHFFWGMSVRNLLRKKGFGEDYFGIHNLDDIYVWLVEEALGLR